MEHSVGELLEEDRLKKISRSIREYIPVSQGDEAPNSEEIM
jgi:hypothetical protein